MPIEDDPPAGAPEWVVTYGDMMSLLLTFFIMLVSMSELKTDDGKYRALMDAIKQAFGSDFGRAATPGNSLQKNSAFDKMSSLGFTAEKGTKKANRPDKGPGGANAPVKRLRDGTLVTLGGPVAFEGFSAEMTPELEKQIEQLVAIVADKSNRIEVRGHAAPDPLPEGSAYRDPMDLSFARAKLVADSLIARGIPPARILLSAAGEAEPRTTTRLREQQVMNRRVDVFLIDSYIPPSAESAPEPRDDQNP